MLTSYFTLNALVRAWTPDLVGCVVGDAFSQVRDELTLALAAPEREWMLRVSVRGPFQYLFRAEGYSKARRNVATLFEDAFDRRVTALRLAERDRMLYLDLEGGLAFQVMLFGPRANVFLVEAGGTVREAFQGDAEWAGRPAPAPRPAPVVDTFAAFEARWRADRKTTVQAVAAAFPLLDRTLAAEVVFRAGVTAATPDACTDADRRALFDAGRHLLAALEAPAPRIYWRGRSPEVFALLPLHHLDARDDLTAEPFDTVDAAVRVYVRRRLADVRFRAAYAPLEKALAAARDHHRAAAARMLDELSRESRADRYERWGHLLMANPGAVPPGAETVTLPDLFAGGAPVTIPLDPTRTAVENAQRYYEKARRTRQARAHAEERMAEAERRAAEADALLAELRTLHTRADVERFRTTHADRLAPFLASGQRSADAFPFRRFPLGQGYEVWVGKSARQNDELTFRHARKYDLWLHARGVPGSHAVLRLPHRQARPGRDVRERAAAIAAYFSKARGSSLVPVIVTERKYVRKPKGAPLGAVAVDREEVLLVAPGLPEGGED
ncbi:MAG: hypothetical protein KatS3mg042_1739 [Rhodothermaceae bacterium]|nr:MAG: hypothetical protein KatS3mg042_1739 [Rhodothermaceae bacterium]